MNLTIGNTAIRDLRNNTRTRYIASTAAAVMAFSAVAGFSGALSSHARRPESPSTERNTAVRYAQPTAKTHVVYYLVDAHQTSHQISSVAAELENPNVVVRVVSLQESQTEQAFLQAVREQAPNSYDNVQVVDLRNR